MRSTWILLATLVLVLPAVAVGWTPDPDIEHKLSAPLESVGSPNPAEDRWVAFVVDGLEQGGETPNTAHRFSKSTADYSINGEKVAREIYVSRDNPDVVLILNGGKPNEGEFVVDFGTKQVNAGAFRGGVFVSASKDSAVVILDRESIDPGSPVTGGGVNPRFGERTVTWH